MPPINKSRRDLFVMMGLDGLGHRSPKEWLSGYRVGVLGTKCSVLPGRSAVRWSPTAEFPNSVRVLLQSRASGSGLGSPIRVK